MLLSNTLKSLTAIEQARVRVSAASSSNLLNSADTDTTYEGLFLKSHVVFENYLEKLFFLIVSSKINYPQTRAKLRANFTSTRSAVQITKGGDDYLDWLPYKKTLSRAETWLVSGRPFSELEDGDRQFLRAATTTRNHIAHNSPHTKKLFLSKVIGNSNLPPTKRNPAGWLRSKTRLGHQDDRLQAYIMQYGQCAKQLYPAALASRELK